MIEADRFWAFFVAALALAVLPGPGILYVLARSLSGGRREGVLSSFGTALGGTFHVLAAAIGLSALLLASSFAFTVVKYAGAACLVYLGLRTLLARDKGGVEVEAPPLRGAFLQGAVTEALNPKTALFFLAFIPQFVDTGRGSVFWQFVLLGTLSVSLNTLADLVVAAFAGPLGTRLRVNARFRQRQRLASGSAMIALGTYAAVER